MSQITILNGTNELVRIAIYKKPVLQPTLQTIAWQIVAPPPGGQTVVPIPEDFQVYAEYSLDPNNPDPTSPTATVNQTNTVNFDETTARFQIQSVSSQDKRAAGAYINQVFNDLQLNEVRLENNFGVGVLSHIQKDNVDIYAPQVLWPGAVRIEDVRSTLYLAAVGQFVYQGSRLVDEEIQMTETAILEGGTALVTGSMWKGYSIVASS
ncbi:MAG TPA: hypothetical protein VLQ45_31505 [Thermoanaerobaculia bacterium]|nr:hypothetical protein [Thermoanaerobaculia bacterium]